MPSPILPRRRFMQLSAAGVLGLLARNLPAQTQPSRRPNVIVIVADDLGYGDLGCQGSTQAKTPHIDSIARDGVRFTDGYVSCPVCSPTRAGLMTGRYQQRFGHEFNPGNPEPENFGLPLTETTLADALKKEGYATGMVGKWHLGTTPTFHPMNRGFDEFYGFLRGAHSYVNLEQDGPLSIHRGRETIPEKGYLTELFAREAVSFVERHQAHPFFLYLTFNAVHAPLEDPPQKYLERFEHVKDRQRRTMLAMLAVMDDAVGEVLTKLEQLRLTENTLIFFISDNGGPTRVNSSLNAPLTGVKSQTREGGIRVPFMMQWPGVLPAGKVESSPVIALDIFPTALAAAGGAERNVDGVNLLPYLTGKKQDVPHEWLYWRMGNEQAVRHGDFKLVRATPDPWKLHNVRTDPGEKQDLAATQPDLLAKLDAAYTKWSNQMSAPAWPEKRRNPRNRPVD